MQKKTGVGTSRLHGRFALYSVPFLFCTLHGSYYLSPFFSCSLFFWFVCSLLLIFLYMILHIINTYCSTHILYYILYFSFVVSSLHIEISFVETLSFYSLFATTNKIINKWFIYFIIHTNFFTKENLFLVSASCKWKFSLALLY